MTKILKWSVRLQDSISLKPEGNPLFFGQDGEGNLAYWARNDEPLRYTDLCIVGTGWLWPSGDWEHIASTKDGPFIWHLLGRRIHQ